MKTYISRGTKWLAIFALFSVAVLITGVIFIVVNSSNIGLQIWLTMFGGLMSLLFISCYFAEKSRKLTVDGEKIVLPRGADKNGKMSFQRTVVNMAEISSVESNLYKGDGIFSKDTYFHTLKLKDGTKIKFTLSAYGNDAEKEILGIINKSI